ncbi:TBCC domain-containing protein 1 [Strongylocentrotus purpuratus]|uniref:TBCC domain-containing protein 1 n=1 Tax=Strongylocentrotus purpuratus TaxID=7668 RepID=A0A7M7T1N7_STRPU|nr:TBCC domain-containing protein 1 [Strongylocentrotus purpuratus]|eukprot:XP_787388.2 PREDICTED: TBCC domain-containing protein 1 isoform X2 [Strongylocentrotus purpuratus]
MAHASANLWLKFDTFNIGILPVAPHPKLSLHYLKKIALYAKNKGKAGYPRLAYSTWKHIACNKLGMLEDLAWMYFEGFDMLCEYSPEERLQRRQDAVRHAKNIDTWKNIQSVDTLQFLLYLYLQQLHKISLRSSLVSGEEWPSRARSPSPDIDGRTSPGLGSSTKSVDESNQQVFVLNHLSDILGLLAEADSYSSTANDVLLSVQSVEALGLLFEGSVNKNKSVQLVHQVALHQQTQAKSGYSKITQAFSFKTFESWLRSSLCNSPFGVTGCIASGHRLQWSSGEDGAKRGRVATNCNKAPKSSQLVILSQISKQTLAKSSQILVDSRIKIHRCHYAFIYLLSPVRSVSIEKCRHTTIIVGAVETAVHLVGCEHVTVIAAAGRFSVSGSTLCTLHMLTPSRPLLLGGNDSITLAPYHTHYAMLHQHMAAVGLAEKPNHWNSPICVGPDHTEEHPVHRCMSPKEFFTFVIPFDMDGITAEIPGGLPSRYERALVDREGQINNWQQAVKDAGLDVEQKKQFQILVENKFQIWLAETGHKRELDGLVPSGGSPGK